MTNTSQSWTFGRRNFMPLVHQARRTLREHERGNPFVTEDGIRDEIGALSAAYLATCSPRVACLLKVELDRLEGIV
jgi:hypothetical protein